MIWELVCIFGVFCGGYREERRILERNSKPRKISLFGDVGLFPSRALLQDHNTWASNTTEYTGQLQRNTDIEKSIRYVFGLRARFYRDGAI